MKIGKWFLAEPLLDEPGDTGGGGGGAADSGAGGNPAPVADPTPIELSDDALIKVKGSDKPVKFGEHVRGFQSQFTKASQRAAQLERQLQEHQAKVKAYEQQLQQRQSQQGGQQEDVFAALRQLPYLSGEDAVEVVQSIGEQIRQRDQVLMGALRKIQQMEQLVGGLTQNYSTTSFDQKINRWLSEGGYPPEAANLAKEIYLAYEGDDLDDEFPRIFEQRWNEITKIIEARKAAAVQAARRPAFVPGKGGAAGPSKPLEMKPNATAKEIAEQLWGSWNETGT